MTAEPLTDEATKRRAAEAHQALAVVTPMFEAMRADIYRELMSTNVTQDQKRERLVNSLQVLEAVKKALVEAVEAGEYLRHVATMTAILQR